MPAYSAIEKRHATRAVICLGLVSLFADMTYEGMHSVVGPYLKELGASVLVVSVISGLGEMFAASLRYFSGKFADRTRAYWVLAGAGYLVNVFVVPALAFVGHWQVAALLMVAERTGKALRGPSRDVLLSEATEVTGHGWGFGLHAAMDQTGAVIGPLLMMVAVGRYQHFAPAFLWLGIPAVLAVLALFAARAMYASRPAAPNPKPARPIPAVFWKYALAAGLLACGFVDFPVLTFHFQKEQIFQPETLPLLYAGAMGVNGLTALVFGRLFDRFGLVILPLGILITLLTLPLGFLGGQTACIAAVACWATGLGIQDATLRSGISQVVSMNKRGTAFGAFNGIYGVMWFLGSVAMGLLYSWTPIALVVFGVAMQLGAAALFVIILRPLAIERDAQAAA